MSETSGLSVLERYWYNACPLNRSSTVQQARDAVPNRFKTGNHEALELLNPKPLTLNPETRSP